MKFIYKFELVLAILFTLHGTTSLADRPIDIVEENAFVAEDGTQWMLVYNVNQRREPLQESALQKIVQTQSCVLNDADAFQGNQQDLCIIETSQGLVSVVTQKQGIYGKIGVRPVRSSHLLQFTKNTLNQVKELSFIVVSFGLRGLHEIKCVAIGGAVGLVSIATKTALYTISGTTGAIFEVLSIPFRIIGLITPRFLWGVAGISSVQTTRYGHLNKLQHELHQQRQDLALLLNVH